MQIPRPNRWVYLGITLFFQITLSGVLFGWNSIRPLLSERGVFSAECDVGEKTCDAQTVKLDLVFTIAAAVLTLSGVILGPMMDRFGPRIVRMISAVFFIAACVMIGIASDNSVLWFFGFSCIGFAGGGVQLTSFNISVLFPGHESAMVSVIAGCFAASSSMFLFAQKAHESLGTPISPLFLYYSINGGLCLVTALLWPSQAFNGPQDLRLSDDLLRLSNNNNSSSNSSLSHSSQPLLKDVEEGGGAVEVQNMAGDISHPKDVKLTVLHVTRARWIDFTHLSLKEQLQTPECFLPILWFALLSLTTTFFLSSVADQLHAMGGGKEMDAFAIIYPLGFIGTPIVGMLQDRFSFPFVFFIVNVVLLVYQGLTLVPVPELQILTYIIFATGRQYVFALFFSCIGSMFGYGTFGVITGIGNLASALSTLLNYPLSAMCTHIGQYYQVNIGMTAAVGTQFFVAWYLDRRFRKWEAQQQLRVN